MSCITRREIRILYVILSLKTEGKRSLGGDVGILKMDIKVAEGWFQEWVVDTVMCLWDP